jgi:hypothetical protein
MVVLFFRSRRRPSDSVPLSNHIELRPIQPRAFPAVPRRRQAMAARQASVAAAASDDSAKSRSPVPIDSVVPRVGHEGAEAQQRLPFARSGPAASPLPAQ